MIDRQSVPLLAIEELSIEFHTRSGTVRALDRVGFSLKRGETLALVGESVKKLLPQAENVPGELHGLDGL